MREVERYYLRMPRSINRHSVRVFESGGVLYELDRTTDASPPFFCLSKLPTDGYGRLAATIPVGGREYWGDGIRWPAALALAASAIQEARPC